MKSLTRITIIVFLITILSKILGIIRESILAFQFGTSYVVDAYSIAISFPSIIFAIFAGGVARSFVPIITRIKQPQKKIAFTNNVSIVLGTISLIFAAACMIFSGKITELLAPGFGTESETLAKHFIFLISMNLPIMVVYNIILAYLTSEEHFIVVNLCNSILANVIIIFSILVASVYHVDLLIWGYMLSYIIPLVCLTVFSCKRTDYEIRMEFKLKDSDFVELIRLAIPLGASLLLNQINSMVDRALASLIGEGAIAVLTYANKVQLLFYTLITTIVINVCYPRINKFFAEDKYDEGMNYISKGMMITSFVGIPVTVGLICFAEPIISLLFERGAFGSESTLGTAHCLLFYSIGMIFYSYREILLHALAAHKKQKMILKNTMIAIGINIILSVVLINFMQEKGLALATSIAGLVASMLMYNDIRKLNLKLWNKCMVLDLIKTCILSAIAAIIGIFIYGALNSLFMETIALLGAIVGMCVIYLVGALFFKMNIFRWGISAVIKR